MSRTWPRVLAALFFLAVFLLLLGAGMQKPLDHDEHQFVAGGALLADRLLLPYRDYPYFHVPNLTFIYAALFAVTDYHLLAARLFSILCAWLTVGVVFSLALRLFSRLPPLPRFFIAAGAGVLLLTNPLFTYTSGKAWNHDLPVLLTLLALAAYSHGARQEEGRRGAFLSGLLVGLAAGTRLSFALVILPFLGLLLWYPGHAGRRRGRLVGSFGLGLFLALLPSLALGALAPRQFLFGNLDYARYNTLYRREMGFAEGDVSAIAMSLAGKLSYLARYVVSAPGNLLLLLSFLFFALALNAPNRWQGPYRLELTLLLLLVPFLLLGSFAPTPAFFQYFYAPVPFLLLGALYGMANLPGQEARGKWSLVLLAHVVILAGAYGVKSYENVKNLLAPGNWLPVQAHQTGVEIAAVVGQGRVLTLAPLFPLEGGAQIYEQFATGAFAWRVAPLVSASDRQAMGMVSADELTGLLRAQPPDAILVGYEGELERPFVEYAEAGGYRPLTLAGGKVLWVSPRLGATVPSARIALKPLLTRQPPGRTGYDVGMVKGQRGQVAQVEPTDPGGIAAGVRLPALCLLLLQQHQVGHADRPATGIAPRIAKGIKLLQVFRFEARFLPQFAAGSGFQRLVRFHEPAGQRPLPGKGRPGAADEQHLGLPPLPPDHHHVHRHSG